MLIQPDGIDGKGVNWQHELMKQEAEQLRKESHIIVLDPRYPVETAFLNEIHCLSIVCQRNLWIFDQKCEGGCFGNLINYTDLKRDKAFIIVPKKWRWSGELREDIYEKLALKLSMNDVNNLKKYLKNNNAPQWSNLVQENNNFEQWSLLVKAKQFLKIFRKIMDRRLPFIQTRSLYVYGEEEINHLGVLREGAIDPLLKEISEELKTGEIPEYDKNKIGTIVMIGECYHIRYEDGNKMSLLKTTHLLDVIVPFFISITSDQSQIDKWKDVYNVRMESQYLAIPGTGNRFKFGKYLRKDEMNLDGVRNAEVYEMKIWYDCDICYLFKEDILDIIINDDCEAWRQRNNLTLWYGVNDYSKLLEVRRLKLVNEKQAKKIIDLENYIHRLEDMVKKYKIKYCINHSKGNGNNNQY